MLSRTLYLNLGLGACLLSWLSAAMAQTPSVHIYNWSAYFGPTTLKDFSRDTGIEHVYDTFDSNEIMQAKMLTGRSGYDVVVAGDSILPTLIKAGALQELDRQQLPHRQNLDSQLLDKLRTNDPENRYAVPYLWGTTGIGYNVDKVRAVLGKDAPVNSWDLLFKEENLAKLSKCGVAMLDSSSEVLPVALHYLGLPPDSTDPEDYKKAKALLLKLRPYITYFSSSKFTADLVNGNICVAMGWSGAVLAARRDAEQAGNGVKLEYSLPVEGAPVWIDTLVLVKDAPNPVQGLAFIDYLMRPEVIAPASELLNYPNGNLTATPLIPGEMRNNPNIYPSAEVMAKLFSLQPLPQKAERERTRVWTSITTDQ